MCGTNSVGTSPTIASNATSLAGGGASTTTTSVAGASGGGALPTPPVAGAVAGASGGGAAGADALGPLLAQVTAAIESLKQAIAGGGLIGGGATPPTTPPGVEGGGAPGKTDGGCGCGMPGCGGSPTQAPPTPTQTPEQKPEQKGDKADGHKHGKGKGKGKGHTKGKHGDKHGDKDAPPKPGTTPPNPGQVDQGGGPPPPPPANNGGNGSGNGGSGGADGAPTTTGGGGFSTAPYQGVTAPGWYYWTSPDNKWHATDKNHAGAKYLVRDGNSWKEGTPPSTSGSGGFSTAPYQGVTAPGWYYWTSPDNKWHATDKNHAGAKYLVRDGNGWKEGTPPS